MKKVLFLGCLCILSISVNAQTDSNKVAVETIKKDSVAPDYVVELNSRALVVGKKVSDDGREVGIMTADKGLVLIPKYQIKSIVVASSMPTVDGKRVFENPHPSRYLYSPSGIPLKKGEGYVQAIYWVAFQGQYALTDHWSIGATSPLWAAPFLVNVKYTNTLKTDPAGKNNIYLATGIQAGSLSYIDPGTWLGIGYAGLTFGNPESNVTINGGVLLNSYKSTDYNYYYDPITQKYTYEYSESRLTDYLPAVSVSWNKRMNGTMSFMGEIWYVNNMIIGGPGMRFFSGRKNAIDVALLGGVDLEWGEGIFGVPMVSWTRKLGGK